MATTIPNYFNSTEAADYLGLSDSMIRRYCRDGKLKARQFGRNWAILKSELDRFKSTDRPVGNPSFRR